MRSASIKFQANKIAKQLRCLAEMVGDWFELVNRDLAAASSTPL